MGLFGSNSITTVGTQVVRVLEDKHVPDSIATGVSKNLYSGDDQMVEYVMEEFTQSIGLRAQRMHGFGESQYIYGLPSSSLRTSSAAREATLAVIRAQVGAPVELNYYHFGPFNSLHFAWEHLIAAYGYNSSTNQLIVDNKSVYLKDMQVILNHASLADRSNGSMDQWGPAPNSGKLPSLAYDPATLAAMAKPTPFAVDSAAARNYILVTYCWEENNLVTVEGIVITRKVIKEAKLQFDIAAYDDSGDYHQAAYTLNGLIHYWTYKDNSGTNPSIDAAFQTSYSNGGKFFPIVYFRYAKVSGTKDKTSRWYTDSKRLTKYLGINFDDVTNAVNSNPDIDQVEQAMMMFAVPANTDNQLERRYLFDFFSDIYNAMSTTSGAVSTSMGAATATRLLTGDGQGTSYIIEDKRFKMALSYSTIVSRLVAGKIGKVGHYDSGYYTSPAQMEVELLDGGKTTWNSTTKYHAYYHQISENVYREIRVFGLSMKYWIFEGYTTTGNEGDDILLIPIDQNITKHYSIPDKEVLYARSLHYVFNSKVVTKLKWYQTGLFRFITLVILVIIAIYTYGSTLGAIAALLGGEAAAEQAIMAVIYKLIISAVVNAVIRLFIKAVGTKYSLLTALVLAAAAIYQMFTGNTTTSLPSSEDLLAASGGIVKNVIREIGMEVQDLLKAQHEFDLYVHHQEKLLEDTKALLDSSLRVDPLIIFGETPTDFYQRTVHSGNIGPMGIDIVSNYVDYALQLPKISDTLGGLTT